ncbi:unnamed protein product [Heligmosomoides polygyrus]|uniref:AraC family transcriptional regulator n=1 Tax=Heligmosomoides polygyrus TaxID=6339 RepID=A0A183GVV7_HELPZ|nr:unnamed protein product [Heligmosomoides polygyrus]
MNVSHSPARRLVELSSAVAVYAAHFDGIARRLALDPERPGVASSRRAVEDVYPVTISRCIEGLLVVIPF